MCSFIHYLVCVGLCEKHSETAKMNKALALQWMDPTLEGEVDVEEGRMVSELSERRMGGCSLWAAVSSLCAWCCVDIGSFDSHP